MAIKKKQYSFRADSDITRFLDSLDNGVKTRVINHALRQMQMHFKEGREDRFVAMLMRVPESD